MVKFIAELKCKPGHADRVAAALRDLVGPSRAESGCLSYDPCRAVADPNRLLVLEEWESQAALDAHMETPHFQGFVANIGDGLDGGPVLQFIERL